MTTPHDRCLPQAALADLADLPATGRWVRSGTTRLHVLDYGGSGTPLLILPGITSPAVTMDFVACELTDLVRPLVLDVRGRGLSDGGGSYALEEYAEDTEAVVTGLGLERPVLFGHSMGARIAAVTAVRGKVALRGTVLGDPPMSGPGRGPYPTPLGAFLDQLTQARRGTDADEVARSWPRWPRREQELRARWLVEAATRRRSRRRTAASRARTSSTGGPPCPVRRRCCTARTAPSSPRRARPRRPGCSRRRSSPRSPTRATCCSGTTCRLAVAALREALRPMLT